MKSRKTYLMSKQQSKHCWVCGWEIPEDSVDPDFCSIKCWNEERGEKPEEPEYDPYDPKNFEGYPVGK